MEAVYTGLGMMITLLGGNRTILWEGLKTLGHCHYEREVAGSNPVHATCYGLPVLRAQLALLSPGG